eukprot:CAMPEP_0116893020 /NCGR_PEP_ID=MMETSP0467-20121206/3103_1 /TAXON_ID=283647 /ORGANISM="Mesodinium pulex, Strain SPMC105" /LENGTH=96 /DNA_ID=CAMNT_0004562451 /DNA_START=1561 /DNA_END=1851 /DNA_ORIENTATION=-
MGSPNTSAMTTLKGNFWLINVMASASSSLPMETSKLATGKMELNVGKGSTTTLTGWCRRESLRKTYSTVGASSNGPTVPNTKGSGRIPSAQGTAAF